MSHRGPKSQRPGREPIAEDEKTFTMEGDAVAAAGAAHGLFDVLTGTAMAFDMEPVDQLLAACMTVAMLVKRHNVVESDALRVLSKCIRGTHYNPHGFKRGDA